MRIVVLGGSGMLGAMVLDRLHGSGDADVVATVRDEAIGAELAGRLHGIGIRHLDARLATDADLMLLLEGAQWVINAIGVIKPYIRDDRAADVERAIDVNARFPHRLARAAEKSGTRVLQIATDCVFAGTRGAYAETDAHDPLDVYGKTKSLGEVHSPAVHHLRCSIIGPELRGHASLLDWFVRQPPGSVVKGFVNHRWNGVTTLQFARLCGGIVADNLILPHVLHVVPGNVVTKADLLERLAGAYERRDVTIERVDAPTAVDRTLRTGQPDLNLTVWRAAGYPAPPTVETMLDELAAGRGNWQATVGQS